ncbi:pilus assembly protein PilM, partial [bacterium]|nr:pilus assembly protein PilM [bacterium]
KMAFWSIKKPLVGLDIGSSSIKAVVLKMSSRGIQLKHLGSVPLHPDTIVDGSIMDTGAVSSAILDLFTQERIKIKDVVIAVAGNAVTVKPITLPNMTEEELKDSIKYEAEQYIPSDIEDVNLAYQIISRNSPDGHMTAVLVAVRKEKIDDYLRPVLQAGLNPLIVDVEGFALEHYFEANYEIVPDEVLALIDLGASVMNINILDGGVHALYRDIVIGGSQYTQEIQKKVSVSFEEAEMIKINQDVSKAINSKELQFIFNSVTKQIANNIQNTIDFYISTSNKPNARVDKIILSGGCVNIRDIEKDLMSILNIPVEKANPFINIEFNSKDFEAEYIEKAAPMFAVSIGLALRRVGDR